MELPSKAADVSGEQETSPEAAEPATIGEQLQVLRDRVAARHPFTATAEDVVELIDILLSTMPKRALSTEI